MSLTLANITKMSTGNKHLVAVDVTFDSSYPTGGESLTPADLGLLNIDFALVDVGAAAAGTSGVVVKYDRTNSKLQAFQAPAAGTHTHTAPAFTGTAHDHDVVVTGDAETAVSESVTAAGTVAAIAAGGSISAGGLAEVANTTSLSTIKVQVWAIGA